MNLQFISWDDLNAIKENVLIGLMQLGARCSDGSC